MEIDVSTPALLFPAISLLLLAYTNRFLGLASLIRKLHERMTADNREVIQTQVDNLRWRVQLIIWMQALGVLSLVLCTASMLSLLLAEMDIGLITFAISLALMLASLVASFIEIAISGNALKVELEGIENH